MKAKVVQTVRSGKPVHVSLCRPVVRPRRSCAPETAARLAALLQPALRVGPANDPLEHEAERLSERVATMAAPGHAPVAGEAAREGAMARRAGVDDQPNLDALETVPPIPADHQDPEIDKNEEVDTAGVDQSELDELEAGDPAPPPGDAVVPDRDPGAAAVVGAAGGDAPLDVAQKVAQPGAGRALPESVRRFMEPRFGIGFERVRVHDGPEDRRAAARIGARAFTHRNRIWLGDGESVENRRLMAHELTHVVQQKGGTEPARAREIAIDAPAEEPSVRRGYLRDKAEKYARKVPGYMLLTVILGKSPITGNRVERTATNLIGGFLGLLPGGDAIFQKLVESRALEKAYAWVQTRLGELNITWSRIKGLIGDFIDEMPSWSPVKVAKRIFGPLVNDIITFIGDIKDKILEFIVRSALALAGSFGEKVWAVIEKARDTISLILSDPLGFAKNLIKAVVGGFKQFGSKAWEHLKKGLLGWLFGGLQNAGIEMPEKLDFKGLISIGLQIIGLSYAKFRALLVKRLGKNGEKKVAFIEKSVDVVKILVKEGFVGVWQRFLSMIEGFKETVIGGIQKFVVETLIKGALSWVAGLSNPVGAIVKVALAIYNMIKAFLERIDQILEVANSIFSSIGAIARGQTKQAADFIETTIGNAIPVVLAFIAAIIPISGITRSIKSIIKKLQTPVGNAMKTMVDFLVKKTKKLFSKLLGKVNKKRELPGYKFKIGTVEHSLFAQKKGDKFQLMVASNTPQDVGDAQASTKAEIDKAVELGDESKQLELFGKTFQVEVDQAEKQVESVKVSETRTSQNKPAEKSADEMQDAIEKLLEHGPPLQFDLFIAVDAKAGNLIRAREPRLPEVEGGVDTHFKRSQITKEAIATVTSKFEYSKRALERISNYYENDHLPEKSLGKLVKQYVATLANGKDAVESVKRSGTKSKPAEDAKAKMLGDIDMIEVGEKAGSLPAMTVYRPTHRQKTSADADRDHGKVIEDARKGKDLDEKVSLLRQGISAQLDKEIEETKKLYDEDMGAPKEIRSQVNAGIKQIYDENRRIYGIFSKKKPAQLDETREGAESDLPITGDSKDVPDFLTLEGSKVEHGSRPTGFGKYLEYDHVIDGSIALKAKALSLGDPAIKEPARAKALARVHENADEAEKKAVAARIASLGGSVFDESEVASYKYDKAGTIALYRPIHRQITPALNVEAAKGILTKVNMDAAIDTIASYLATGEDSRKEAGLELIRAGVRARFDDILRTHIGAITGEYGTEQGEVETINGGKGASQQMAMITARVKNSLRELNAASVDLVK